MNKIKSFTAENAALIGVFALLAIYPIIITDKYFNITATRYVFFTLTSSVFLAVCLLLKINTAESPMNPGKQKLSTADVSFLLFVIVAAISSLSSSYGIALTLSGAGGRRMGLLMILAMFFAYVFISRFYRIREYEFIFFGVIGAASAAFGMLQFIGLNPLGFLDSLSELDSVRFISFMGNINIYSSYICLVLPLAMYMFCFSEKKLNSVLWLLVSALTFIGQMTSISDSGYLGIGAAMLVLSVLTAKNKKTFQRFFMLVITFLVSAGIFELIWKTFGDPERPNSVPNGIIANPVVIAVGSIVSALVIIALNRFELSEKFYKRFRMFVIITVVAVLAVCVGLIVWFTWIEPDAKLGKFTNYLRFSYTWGNGRRYAWTRLLEIFRELPLHKKLIGTGPETFGYEIVSRHSDEMYELFGFHYDNAHNDVLQYLITMGLCGMLSYVSLVASAVKSCIKSENTINRAIMLPIVAFFVQSLVNITQPITTPLFFVFLAFSQCRPYEEKRHSLADIRMNDTTEDENNEKQGT